MTRKDEIDRLKQNLVNCRQDLQRIIAKYQTLKVGNLQGQQKKDQELKDLRDKLTTYSQERDNIKRELDDKVKELENSNLSNADKQAQINQLLVENKSELEPINQILLETWTSYNQQRDNMVNHLLKPCSLCESNRQTKNWLFGIIFALLLLLGLFFLLGYCCSKRKKTPLNTI